MIEKDTPDVIEILGDLTERYRLAFAKISQGERVGFALSLIALPSGQTAVEEEIDKKTGKKTGRKISNPQLISMLHTYVEIPGAIMGSAATATQINQISGHTDEVIEQRTREVLTDLLGARSQQIAQQLSDAQAALSNGHSAPTAGRIALGEGPNTGDDVHRAFEEFLGGK